MPTTGGSSGPSSPFASAGSQSVVRAEGSSAGPGRRSVSARLARRRRDGLAREGDDLDRVLGRDPGHGRAGRPQQSPRDLAPRDRLDRLGGAQPERPCQAAALVGRSARVGRLHARRHVHRDDHPAPARLAHRPRHDRLEERRHQHQHRQEPEPEQPQARPPRDQPPLLARERQRQHQRDPPGRDPEPAPPPAGQHEPGPAGQVERHRVPPGARPAREASSGRCKKCRCWINCHFAMSMNRDVTGDSPSGPDGGSPATALYSNDFGGWTPSHDAIGRTEAPEVRPSHPSSIPSCAPTPK